jgi:L-fuculose-phosphate aldolase
MKCNVNTGLTAEARAICGDPAFVRYALMGTKELASLAAESIISSNILLFENHGVLAVGNSLLQAFDRLEVLENAARMTLIVEMVGKKSALTKSRIRELDRIFR